MSMVSTRTPSVVGMNADVFTDWLDKRFSKNPKNGDHSIKKKRCLNVAGHEVACVQDTAAVNPALLWGAAGIVLLLLVKR